VLYTKADQGLSIIYSMGNKLTLLDPCVSTARRCAKRSTNRRPVSVSVRLAVRESVTLVWIVSKQLQMSSNFFLSW